MLDVHLPHEPTHTWRDFFIHIATIVIGLLIAVALEQTVELIQHTHQRAELHEALRDDTAKTIEDTERVEHFHTVMDKRLSDRIDQVDDALDTHHPIADPLPLEHLDFDVPDDPAWKAARSSGLLELLSQQDIKAYTEVDDIMGYTEARHVEMNNKAVPLREFTDRFVRRRNPRPDLSRATPEDLMQYRALLVSYRDGIDIYSRWCHGIQGAEIAILHGERDLNRIQKAER
jgi:hypothetical protein